jgi:hypothetical protein
MVYSIYIITIGSHSVHNDYLLTHPQDLTPEKIRFFPPDFENPAYYPICPIYPQSGRSWTSCKVSSHSEKQKRKGKTKTYARDKSLSNLRGDTVNLSLKLTITPHHTLSLFPRTLPALPYPRAPTCHHWLGSLPNGSL